MRIDKIDKLFLRDYFAICRKYLKYFQVGEDNLEIATAGGFATLGLSDKEEIENHIKFLTRELKGGRL